LGLVNDEKGFHMLAGAISYLIPMRRLGQALSKYFLFSALDVVQLCEYLCKTNYNGKESTQIPYTQYDHRYADHLSQTVRCISQVTKIIIKVMLTVRTIH